MIAACQLHILGVQDHVQAVLGALLVQVEQVAQTQGLFAVFVAVRVGNAPPGGTKGRAILGQTVFLQPILYFVPGHGDGGLIRKFEVFGADLHTPLLDSGHFARQMVQVYHHAGAQHTGHLRVEDARGQQVQDELAFLGDNGMSGVIAALIAGDDISVFSQQIDDAALALIAPVDASNCGKHTMLRSPFYLFPAQGRNFSLIFGCGMIILAGRKCVKRILYIAAM